MTRWVSGQKAISYRDCIRAGVILLATSVVLIGGYSLLNYVKFNFFRHLSDDRFQFLDSHGEVPGTPSGSIRGRARGADKGAGRAIN